MAAIFISYRRSDGGGHAGRLRDRLVHWYDAGVLFYDLENIGSGAVFPDTLAAGIASASAVLVLIGPGWLDEINRRAALPEVDYVRREVEQALARHAAGEPLTVLPVLLGAAMPPAAALATPLRATLAPLCDMLNPHAFGGTQSDWDHQFVRLRERLAGIDGVPAARFRPPPGAVKPFHVSGQSVSANFHDPTGLLGRLRAGLQGESGRAVLVARRAALHGMGGIGKTQLALAYSRDFCDAYAGVWWFAAETDAGLQLDALACCNATQAPVGEGELPSLALQRWLAAQPGVWLLVFDNAENAAALRPHLPDAGLHHVLITSRDPAWGGLASAVELDVWTHEEGADFLAARCQVHRGAICWRCQLTWAGYRWRWNRRQATSRRPAAASPTTVSCWPAPGRCSTAAAPPSPATSAASPRRCRSPSTV